MGLIGDLRYALRTLKRVPVFTATAVASLAVGIGSSTTVFSLVEAAMLRPPPFVEPDQLTLLTITRRSPSQTDQRLRWSWKQFQLLERSVQSFDGVASVSNNVLTVTGVDDPEPLPVEIVSSRYLTVMRAPLALGAGFTNGDRSGSSSSSEVVLGYDLWQRRFGGAQNAVGRTLHLNGVPLTVVGVAARGFTGISGLAQAWVPAVMAPQLSYRDYLTTNQNFIAVVGRLRQGVSINSARAELAVVGERIHAEQPSESNTRDDTFSATLATINDVRVDSVTRRALMLLTAAAAVLLLIACANVASLLLGRMAERRREIAIRLAVGAGRGRLIRQLLAESGVLATIGGFLGIGIAIWSMAAATIPASLARGRNFYGAVGEFAAPAMDWRVLGYAIAISAIALAICGLAPALQAARTDVIGDLKTGARRTYVGASLGLREIVVALQVALVIVLIVGCGLLLASYARLRGTPLGFNPDRLLTFMIRPSEVQYLPPAAPALIDRVLAEVGRASGVEAASVDGCAPLSTQCASAALRIVGRPSPPEGVPLAVRRHYVGPDHFKTLGVTVLRGRGITADDRAESRKIVVINQEAADRFWPNEDPIGRRIWFEGAPVIGSADSSAEIVGIVGNVAYQPLDERPIGPDFFTPYAQFTYSTRMVLVRTTGDPRTAVPAIARAVRAADPSLALFDVQAMTDRARQSWAKQSLQTGLFSLIAVIALCLAVTGLYGVTAFYVVSRTREIGIRLALGAPASRILGVSITQTVRLAIVGGIAGLLGAFVLARVMRATLYETSPFDPAVYVGAGAVLLAAFLIASYVPLRRALRVDPIQVLRSE